MGMRVVDEESTKKIMEKGRRYVLRKTEVLMKHVIKG